MQLNDYIANADVFPILRNWNFLNHAGVAPIPKMSGDAMRRFAQQAEGHVYIDTNWYPDIEKLRDESAAFINASREEISFVKNTSEGLNIVARGIDWKRGDVIVSTEIEYPANIYPWMETARTHGTQLKLVAEKTDADGSRYVPIESILEAATDPKCRMVSLSHVEFASGQRHDLATIGKFCRERGILFCVDAIQSMGVVPIDVRKMNIDYLSADGHKWMLGPEGAGVFYCRKELLDATRPLIIGWMNMLNALDFGKIDFQLKPTAARYEAGSHNVAGLMALRESLKLLTEVGVENISQRIKILTDRLIGRLREKGYDVFSPRGNSSDSGIVSFGSRVHSHDEVYKTLREKKIEIALRVGRLRISPHFYNSVEQMDAVVAALPPSPQ